MISDLGYSKFGKNRMYTSSSLLNHIDYGSLAFLLCFIVVIFIFILSTLIVYYSIVRFTLNNEWCDVNMRYNFDEVMFYMFYDMTPSIGELGNPELINDESHIIYSKLIESRFNLDSLVKHDEKIKLVSEVNNLEKESVSAEVSNNANAFNELSSFGYLSVLPKAKRGDGKPLCMKKLLDKLEDRRESNSIFYYWLLSDFLDDTNAELQRRLRFEDYWDALIDDDEDEPDLLDNRIEIIRQMRLVEYTYGLGVSDLSKERKGELIADLYSGLIADALSYSGRKAKRISPKSANVTKYVSGVSDLRNYVGVASAGRDLLSSIDIDEVSEIGYESYRLKYGFGSWYSYRSSLEASKQTGYSLKNDYSSPADDNS